MTSALGPAVLRDLSEVIATRMGLSFPEEKWPDLARGLKAASDELGLEYPGALAAWLGTGHLTTRQAEVLAGHLTVGETYFLRDHASFEALEERILPPLIASRAPRTRTLRLWSAGCCTGEEAYSLAITCARALPDLPTWSVSVLATDINVKFLAKGNAGVYTKWSFRGAPDWLRPRWFSPTAGGDAAIDPIAKSLVEFRYLNLAEDAYPSLPGHTNAMDVIFCRNVLMYFAPEYQAKVVAGLSRCLVDGGYLLVGAAETSSPLFESFVVEQISGVTAYRKASKPARVGTKIRPVVSVPEPPRPAARDAEPPASIALKVAESRPALPPERRVKVEAAASSTAAVPSDDLLVRARAYADTGLLDEALASCQDAIAADRTSAAARFLHATICHELGTHREEAIALGQVLYLDPDFVLAHRALGELHWRGGRPKEAKRHFTAALEILATKRVGDIVPESEGMTCGRLAESIKAMMEA